MEKFYLYLFVCVLSLSACNNKGSQEHKAGSKISKSATDTLLPVYFYKRLEGTIGDMPVVVHLKRAGDEWEGMYYYQRYGKWMELLFEKDSSRNGRYCFQEFSPVEINTTNHPQQNFLYLYYRSGTFTGTWKGSEGKKNFPVNLQERYPKGSYPFTPAAYLDAVAAFPQEPKSPEAKVNYYYLMADGNTTESKWLNKQLRLQLNLITPDTAKSWTAELRQQAVNYFRDYREEASQFAEEKQLPTFLNYESSSKADIKYNANHYVIVEQMTYEYSGGAHGNWGSKLLVMDVQQKRILSLQDVVHASARQLQPLVEKAFRSQYKLADTDSLNTILFENQLLPNQNFYFTSQGVGFIYNPYEVAAYVMGQIFVFIPYTELNNYLDPEFKRRMNIP